MAIGVVTGSVASWLLARALVAGLAGLSPADPIAYGVATLILALVGLAACYFPGAARGIAQPGRGAARSWLSVPEQ